MVSVWIDVRGGKASHPGASYQSWLFGWTLCHGTMHHTEMKQTGSSPIRSLSVPTMDTLCTDLKGSSIQGKYVSHYPQRGHSLRVGTEVGWVPKIISLLLGGLDRYRN